MEGSTPPTPPANEPEKKEPTLQEVQEIALEASKVAAEAKSKAEAGTAVQQSVETESEKRGIELSEDDAKKIADATIAGLEARGAFEPAPEPTPDPTPAGESVSGDGSSPTPPVPESSPAPAAPEGEAKPRKRTFAERFVGRN